MPRVTRGSCVLAAVVSCSLALGCPGGGTDVTTADRVLTVEGSRQVRHTVVKWFECEECVDGELAAVVALGDLVVPTLGATLKQGPSPASRAAVDLRLRERHAELVELAARDRSIAPGDASDYVGVYMSNFVARYRSRAAYALGEIGTKAALGALRAAPRAELRADVRELVDNALQGNRNP